MSKSEELLRLERDLNEQLELREKLEAEFNRIAEAKEAKCDGEAMVKAAAALGYTLTLGELERSAADLEKLDDDELDAAGGQSAGDEGSKYCRFTHRCDWFFFSLDENACSTTSARFDCPKLAKEKPKYEPGARIDCPYMDTRKPEEREHIMIPGWVPKD